MESYLNITIRIAKAQAEAAIRAIRGELSGLNSPIGLSTSSAVSGVDRLTGSLRSAGYALSATFTAPLLAAGHSLLDFQLKNESALADLKKVYGDNPLGNYSKDVVALQKNFEALSNEYGVNQTEVIGIGAAWAQAGVQGAALAESVRNTLNTMVIGDLDSKASTEALISIQGQYGASTAELTKILAALNVVENTTAIGMGGLIQGFQRAAGAAANGGVTYRELAAMLAAITPYAGSAAQAGNSLKTIISNLEAPSTQASKALQLLGIDIADTGWKSATATDKLKIVAKGFESLSDAQKNVEARALSGAFQISRFDVLLRDIGLSLNKATEGQSRYGRAMEATADPARNAMIAQRELQVVLDSNPKKLQVLSSMMKNELADVLVKLLPLIISVVAAITSMVTWFSNLNPSVQKMVGIFLLVMAALGPVLLYLSAMRDVLRFGGDAVRFFLTPLKLVPFALDVILAPARGVIALLGFLGGLFSTSGKQAAAGAVEVGASMTDMMAVVQANTDAIVASLSIIIDMLAQLLPAAGVRAARATAATMATVAAETEAGMVAADTAVVAGSVSIGTTITLLGSSMVARWMGTWIFIYDETVVGMVRVVGAVEGGMAALLATTETSLMLWNAEFAAAQMRNVAIINGGFMAATSTTRRGMLAIDGEVAAGATATRVGLLSRLASIPGAILAFFMAIPGRIVGLFTALPGMLLRVFSAIGPMLAGAGEAIVGVLAGPIGIGLAAIVLAFALFHKQIAEAWNAVVGWFQSGAGGLAAAFQPIVNIFDAAVSAVINAFNALPLGVRNALQAVVDIVASAAKAVYNLFSYLNPWAHHSPSLVENVTTGMDAISTQFNRLLDISGPINAAYDDIKRFSNAVAGLENHAQTIKINADVTSIRKAGGGQGAVNAYLIETADVARLTAKQNELNDAMTSQQRVVDSLDTSIKKYNADLNVQNDLLGKLQDIQSVAQDKMNQAQADLQMYQTTGISGQKAMSDAIFESQMKEKALQLQMMKIEDVTGPMQDVQSRMDALQGSMDALRGTSKALRDAGASADITGVYDQQAKAMQDQFNSTRTQVSQYDELQKQLTETQRKTQELQLQDSLTYDPLTRQINDAANAMREMPFSEIMRGVTDSKSALERYTAQYDDATRAVKAQQEVIKGITAARDALQTRYDTENVKLDQLKKAYQAVGQAISDVNAELNKLTSAAQAINAANDAAAKAKKGPKLSNLEKNFNAAAGGNFPSALGTGGLSEGVAGDIAGIDKLTQESIKNLKDRLGDLNPFGGIMNKWHEFAAWWGTNVTPNLKQFWNNIFGGGGQGRGLAGPMFDDMRSGAQDVLRFITPLWNGVKNLFALFKPDIIKLWHDLRDAFGQIGNDIGPKLLPLLKSLKDLFVALWPVIKVIAEIIGFVLIAALKLAADVFVNVFGTAIHAIIAIIGDVLQVMTGLIEFVVGVFTGDWGKAWKGIKDIVGGTFSAIWHIVEGFGKLLYGTVKGIVTGVVDFFKWLYDVLVGHSIIPDLVNAIFDWFKKLPGLVLTALENLGKFLLKLFSDAFNGLWSGIKTVWSSVYTWLTTLPGDAVKALAEMGATLYKWAHAAFNRVWDAYRSIWTSVYAWLGGLLASATKGLGNFGAGINKWATGAFTRILDGFKSSWSNTYSWLTGIIDSTLSALGDLNRALGGWATVGFGHILTGFKSAWTAASSWLDGMGSRILSSVGDLKDLLYGVGTGIVGGIKRGIEDSWHNVVDSILSLSSHLPGPVKSFFGIASPSKLMAKEIGEPLGQGIGVGVTDSTVFVMGRMKDLNNSIQNYKFMSPTLPIVSALPSASSFAGLVAMPSASVPFGGSGTGSESASAITYHSEDKRVTVTIEKVEFPNITSSADAEELLDSLEALANGSRE